MQFMFQIIYKVAIKCYVSLIEYRKTEWDTNHFFPKQVQLIDLSQVVNTNHSLTHSLTHS